MMKAKLISGRSLTCMTEGKVYEVLEVIPQTFDYGACYMWPESFIVKNDNGGRTYLNASRFEIAEESK